MSLDRFRTAQDRIWPTPLTELRAGHKQSHWMWFVFPQLRGLGRSETARFYGIAGQTEAAAYLADPLLSQRLTEAAEAMLANRGTPAARILGEVDAMKLRSSATLFAQAGGGPEFTALLDAFFDGPDDATLRLLA
ncbi:DUF1810 domain-containing protein [Falsirhodobacter deserti]|uniref:DUF1810 domain-containing protein n=1 Tax=Falsirhodobacter deserti TaxID=1365611 RepID=UPI000FE3653D|nr:DUF1810 domain-containing protein [Falsirhodobacter deserti]